MQLAKGNHTTGYLLFYGGYMSKEEVSTGIHYPEQRLFWQLWVTGMFLCTLKLKLSVLMRVSLRSAG